MGETMSCCVLREDDMVQLNELDRLGSSASTETISVEETAYPKVLDLADLKTREVAYQKKRQHEAEATLWKQKQQHKLQKHQLEQRIQQDQVLYESQSAVTSPTAKKKKRSSALSKLRSQSLCFSLIGIAIIARFDLMIGAVCLLILLLRSLHNCLPRKEKSATTKADFRRPVTPPSKVTRQPESEPSEEEGANARLKSLSSDRSSFWDDRELISDDEAGDAASQSSGSIGNEPDIENYLNSGYKYSYIIRKARELQKEVEKAGLKPVYKHDISKISGGFANSVLLRFIVACEGNVVHAFKMMKKYSAWRTENYPDGISPAEWIGEIQGAQRGLLLFDMVTNDGQPLIVVRGRCRLKGRTDEQTRRLCVGSIDGLMEQALLLKDKYTDPVTGEAKNTTGKYSCILDLGDFGYSNADLDGLMEVCKIMFKYFPECLGNAWIIHSNYLFACMWAVIAVFLPKRNLSKYVFLRTEKEYKAFFPTIVDPKILHKRYGGLKEDTPLEYVGKYRPTGIPEYIYA